MVVSRVEASPNNRAGCQNKECKDAAVKILKGEYRYAIQVTIQEHQSWQYRHWGCVTPKQIENLIETTGGDTEMVDGYDDVPAEFQEKINFALKNGHIPDEDWKGDLEVNRPGQSGFRVKATKKKAKKNEDGNEDEKPKKKRGRKPKEADDDDDEEEAPAPKKARGKKTAQKAEESEDEVPPPKKARGRPPKKQADASDGEGRAPAPKKAKAKKPAVKDEDDEADAEAPKAAPKKARGRKAAPKEEADEEDDAEEEEAPKPKRGKKAAADTEVKAPVKRGRKKKVADE